VYLIAARSAVSKLGLKLTYVGRMGSREKRERVYQFVEAHDGRDVIYQGWHNRVVTEASRSVIGVHQ
jgi:hypothetical protein